MPRLLSFVVATAVTTLFPAAGILLSAAGQAEAVESPGPAASRDTVLPARAGDVFESETLRGTLIVRGGGEEVRMTSDGPDGPRLTREGGTVRLEPPRGSGDHEVLLEVPSWMPVSIRSRELDVSIAGLEAEVRIEVLRGDVRLEAIGGPVEVRTVDGEVEVRRTEGVMSVFTADGDLRVIGHRGRLRAESTEGDLTLREVEGGTFAASTLDGDVEFDGRIVGDGSLELSTHDGDVRVTLPSSIQADVEVSTFHGGFSSEFRVRTEGFRAGQPLRFRIGEGGARVKLRSFDGDVSIHSR